MRPPDRERELDARLRALSAWAVSQTLLAWSRVDPGNIRGSWPAVLPQLLAIHERAVCEALVATDAYMALKAADGGWAYAVSWRDDRPARPWTTARGGDPGHALTVISWRVLGKIRDGALTTDALAAGARMAAALTGTEPFEASRQATRQRVQTDLRDRR